VHSLGQETLPNLLAVRAFIPHGHCYLWKPELVSLHVISDTLIAIAYYSIPIALIYFVRKRQDLPYASIFLLFGAFIIACGTTHVLEIWTLWHPTYWVSGLVKVITAILSVYTAMELVPIVPQALALVSPTVLEAANRELTREITDRKQVEAALMVSEARYRAIVEDQTELICRFRSDSTILFVNEAYCRYFKKPKEETIGQSYEPDIFADDRELVTQRVALMNRDRPMVTIENRVVVDREVRWTQWNNRMIFDPDGNPIEFQSVGRDITALKQAEEKLRSLNEQRLNLAIEGVGMATWEIDLPTGKALWSAQHFKLLGYEPVPSGEATLEMWQNCVHPEDLEQVMQAVEKARQERSLYSSEHRIVRADDKQILWIAAFGRFLYDENDRAIRINGVFFDITQRKQAEAEIIASLQEKEVLLKEVHHRVKNNLQVICSLLKLQSRSLKEPQSLAVFQDSQNRVRSIALVHEKLYQSESLSQIDIAEYIRDLAKNLFRAYATQAGTISLKIQIDRSFLLNIDTAVSCGLIVNELVSNALEHAFEPGERGEIAIESTTDSDGNLVLIFRDNGRGLPLNFDLEQSQTLGLQLVKDLTEQLRGQIKIESGSRGTQFTLTLSRIKSIEYFPNN
jgi:PAS domain S-box-containing protein